MRNVMISTQTPDMTAFLQILSETGRDQSNEKVDMCTAAVYAVVSFVHFRQGNGGRDGENRNPDAYR
jgi:hypothetical protein